MFAREYSPAENNHYVRIIAAIVTLYIAIFLSGRVHSAVVSGVNLEQRTVTVEWFERGETKGKEVSVCAHKLLRFINIYKSLESEKVTT